MHSKCQSILATYQKNKNASWYMCYTQTNIRSSGGDIDMTSELTGPAAMARAGCMATIIANRRGGLWITNIVHCHVGQQHKYMYMQCHAIVHIQYSIIYASRVKINGQGWLGGLCVYACTITMCVWHVTRRRLTYICGKEIDSIVLFYG